MSPSRGWQDVYTDIATRVRERAEMDAARGNMYAASLLPEVDRKLVKQTVMTHVYGVTIVGARLQVQRRLKERGWGEKTDLTYHTAHYAAKVSPTRMYSQYGM